MSERYTPRHKAGPVTTTGPVPRLRGLLGLTVGLTVGLIIGGTLGGTSSASVGYTAAAKQTCPPGIEKNKPWLCPTPSPSGSPTPSPSATVSPSPTPSATPSPSPSVSPTATTPPATTPPPSPSPTGTLTNCFGDVKSSAGPIDQARLGQCGYPTLATTGVPAGVTLAAYQGPMIVTTSTTVIDGKRIPCGMEIRASSVVIRNSLVTGSCFWGIQVESGSLTITDTEIDCVAATGTGLWGPNFKAARLYIHNCENGLEINANSSITDSYLVAREATSDGHGDGIQSQGGSDVVIDHNTFAGLNPITSSIISNPDGNSRWTVVNNFFSAGALSIYCPENVGGTWTVRNNRFYGPFGNWQSDPHRPAFGFTDGCSGVGTWFGNYRDDDPSIAVNR